MHGKRAEGQTVDAFSAPTELLRLAKKRAAELKMTKSGFYRYTLAKELGYSEEDARAFAEHRGVTNSIERSRDHEHRPGNYVVNNSANSGKADAGAKLLKKGGASVSKPGAK